MNIHFIVGILLTLSFDAGACTFCCGGKAGVTIMPLTRLEATTHTISSSVALSPTSTDTDLVTPTVVEWSISGDDMTIEYTPNAKTDIFQLQIIPVFGEHSRPLLCINLNRIEPSPFINRLMALNSENRLSHIELPQRLSIQVDASLKRKQGILIVLAHINDYYPMLPEMVTDIKRRLGLDGVAEATRF